MKTLLFDVSFIRGPVLYSMLYIFYDSHEVYPYNNHSTHISISSICTSTCQAPLQAVGSYKPLLKIL